MERNTKHHVLTSVGWPTACPMRHTVTSVTTCACYSKFLNREEVWVLVEWESPDNYVKSGESSTLGRESSPSPSWPVDISSREGVD